MKIDFPEIKDISISVDEAAYFLGYGKLHKPEEPILSMINSSIVQMKNVVKPKACAEFFDLKVENELIQFADLKFTSKDLSKNLKNCSKIVLAAVTVGSQADFLIRKAQIQDSAKSSIMQAVGAAFAEHTIETLNNVISKQAEQNGFKTHPRYSPGYGDVPLSFQKEFFRLLPCAKIGLTLMETLIMAPEKSVTAFIGIEKI